MQLVQIVAPTESAISLTTAKAALRILNTDEDDLITDIISSVEEHAQNILNRQLEVATYELYTNDFISTLPKNPIKSISKIEYMDTDGAYVELDSSTYYLYSHNGIGCINYGFIPSTKEHQRAVKITFVCGYDTIPAPIKTYLRVKVSTLYENREEYVIGVSIAEFGNKFIENLLAPYKIRSI